MTIGAAYRVSTGTLTIVNITRGKSKIYTLRYDSDRPEYSCDVQMTEESMKRTDNLSKKVK
jgi:hypothetical protein